MKRHVVVTSGDYRHDEPPPTPSHQEWLDHPGRACRDMDPNFFFPDTGGNVQAKAAKAVCKGCPVKSECLKWAIGNLPHGVAGGLSPDERDRAAERRGRLRVDWGMGT